MEFSISREVSISLNFIKQVEPARRKEKENYKKQTQGLKKLLVNSEVCSKQLGYVNLLVPLCVLGDVLLTYF